MPALISASRLNRSFEPHFLLPGYDGEVYLMVDRLRYCGLASLFFHALNSASNRSFSSVSMFSLS